MSDLVVADVDGYVSHTTVAVEDKVTCLQLASGDLLCGGVLCSRGAWNALAVLAQSALAEAGAVPLVTFSIGAQTVAGA